MTNEYTVIEKTGHKDETNELFDDLNSYGGVLQFTRSGRIAITKLREELLTNYLNEVDNIINNN